MGAEIELRKSVDSRRHNETCKVSHIPIYRKPTHLTKTSGSEGKTSIVMANTGQEIMKRKNKKKALTLDNFYTQNTEQTGEEMKEANTKHDPQNENWPQALAEFKSEIVTKMEEIWQEKWEIAQKEINSLKDRNSQLVEDAKKSNEMISKLETQIKLQKTR